MNENNNSNTNDKKAFPWWGWLMAFAILLLTGLLIASNFDINVSKLVKVPVSNASVGSGDISIDVSAEAFASADCDSDNCNSGSVDTDSESEAVSVDSTCLTKAAKFGFPDDLANYVCNGSYGSGAVGSLPSGTDVEFGTIIFDNATTAWILRKFKTPDIQSYSYEYDGTEMSIFDSKVFDSKECFDTDGNRGVPCKICFNTTDPGCKLDLEFFD